jgi:hypothetical protein
MVRFKSAVAAGSSVVIALVLIGCTPKPAATPASAPTAGPASAADVGYCDQLASLYERYGSPQDQRGEDFTASVAEAINQCHSGNPDGGIATLSRLLKEQDFTLPPRPGKV